MNAAVSLGGEFEINPFSAFATTGKSELALFETGRSALFSILKALSKQGQIRLAVPCYICVSVLTTAKAAGFDVLFYCLDEDLLPDHNSLSGLQFFGSQIVVLTVDYFGVVGTRATDRARAILPGSFVILDQVQGPFKVLDKKGTANAVFNSYRKGLAVPGGASAVAPGLTLEGVPSPHGATSRKLAGMIRKWYVLQESTSAEHSDFLNELKAGEDCLDQFPGPWLASLEVRSLLNKQDFSNVVGKRRRNVDFVLSNLDLDLLEVPKWLTNEMVVNSDCCPLFIPVLIQQRDSVKRFLANKGVYLPHHWPKPDEVVELGAFEKKLYSSELSLVVDQRYEEPQLKNMVDLLHQALASTDL